MKIFFLFFFTLALFSDVICKGDLTRQKPITKKKLGEWKMFGIPKEEHIQRNYQRNKKLIDLDEIPNDLREIIHNKWIEKKINDRSKILPYFMKYRLKELTEKLGDF